MVLACYNSKGGVGKTATAVNLAWRAALDGHRTLLWDLDAQGAATFQLRVEAHVAGGAGGLARGETDVHAAIRGTDHPNLHLLPADIRLRKLDALLASSAGGRRRLGQVVEPTLDAYDVLLIDSPPSMGRTAEAIFRLADRLIVPLIPTPLSVRTLDQLVAFGVAPDRILPLFTMVDRRKALHLDTMNTLPTRYPQVLTASVPYSSDVERMSVERTAVAAFAPGSAADLAYAAVWRELSDRLVL